MEGLDVYFATKSHEFQDFFDSQNAEYEDLPDPWHSRATRFQKLCFLRAVRMDCVEQGIANFVSLCLGPQFVDPPTFDLRRSFADSGPLTPLILILSSGSDPVGDVLAFAEEMGMAKMLDSISLG